MTLAYREYEPSARAAPSVRCIWKLSGDADDAGGDPEPIVSDGCVELVVHRGDPFLQLATNGRLIEQPRAMVVGPTAVPTNVRPTGRIDVVGIRLQPWAAGSLLGISASALRDRIVPLSDLGQRAAAFGALALDEGLDDSIIDALDDLASTTRDPDPLARALVATIASVDEPLSVGLLAAKAGRSVRTVQRAFDTEVGLSPRTLIRLSRMQRALRMARARPALPWIAIAAACGFHDQPHFVREFRELVGELPSRIAPHEDTITGLMIEDSRWVWT
jgi:AraC-like DNA-binding protein